MATIRAEHELHRRRFSRNAGLGVALLLFVGLVYGLTIAKMGTNPTDALGAEAGIEASAEASTDSSAAAPATEAAQ